MINKGIKRSAVGSSIVALLVGVVLASAAWAGGKNKIVHRVNVGGPDACEAFGADGPGCDANFSLHAFLFEDGTARGQWTDQFGHGNGGFHAVIDCVAVNGHEAWVSGMITHSTTDQPGYGVGDPVLTRVADNGRSKQDPPDQISYSWATAISCHQMPQVVLLDMPDGQVTVK